MDQGTNSTKKVHPRSALAWLRITKADTDAAQIAGAGQSFGDGTLAVVLSGAVAPDDAPLTTDNIASIDFTAMPGVEAVSVRAGIETDEIVIYREPTTSGTGLRATDGTTPIEWLTFCYAPGTQPTTSTSTTSTTTSSTSTTSTTTSTLATTTTAAPQVIDVTTTAPTAVLGQQIERVTQPELALTGTNSFRLVFLGAVLIIIGLALTVTNHLTARWQRAR